MNRIKLDLIKQTTSIPIPQLKQITQCNPYAQGWLSQKFPVYPIILNFHLSNPPFNRISLSLKQPYIPEFIVFEGSADSKEYFKFLEIRDFGNCGNIVNNLKQNHHYKYIRMKIYSPIPPKNIDSKSNTCKQVWIRCLQVTFVTFYSCEYVCSMQKSLQLDPCLFRILQLLEYKALLAKNKSKNTKNSQHYRYISNKYYSDIADILTKMKQWKQNTKKLSQQARQNLLQQIQILVQQPLQSLNASLEYDRQGVRKQVSLLQDQLNQFYVHRLNNLHKDVTDYFDKYWNKQVKEQYMRLLSSPDHEDHGKALTNFWAQVKLLKQFPENIEQAIIMYFNYFLQYVHDPLKITAIKIICLLFRNYPLHYDIYFAYERLMFNLFCQLNTQQKQQLFEVSLKCIYTAFQKIPNNLFIQALLNPQHSVKFRTKIIKLEILQKVTLKNIGVDARDRDQIIDYLLDILSIKQITLQHKNRVYNVIAYLASLYGKEFVLERFQKLNTMLTMNMQKIIDKKLQLIKAPKKQQDTTPTCQYCGLAKQSFKDPNIYDLHCFKQCRYLTPCRHCNQVIQIPQLHKHYIQNCQQRNLFKQCQNCNEVIIKLKQDQHHKLCTKELVTKCGLCGEKMQGKLRLKQHILKDGCPNNPR